MANKHEKLPPAFRRVLRPFQAFFRLEASSGILLGLAAVVAFVWANSPSAESYRAIVDYPLQLGVGEHLFRFSFAQFVNDGLMAIFFLLVGMEIKRELAVGELSSLKQALLPLAAALGGMVLPSGIFFLMNRGTPAASGWGIPMATDIAFSLACLALLKGRIPSALVVFLTALAIFDDLGGILVIALFYGSGLHAPWLLGALAVSLVLLICNRLYVRNGIIYGALGAVLWFMLHEGGIHATIAGVVLGLAIPARPQRQGRDILVELRDYITHFLSAKGDHDLSNEHLLHIEETIEDLEPPLNRFEHMLHPYVAYFIVPLFALANSGVSLQGVGLADLAMPLPLGIAAGLFVGKQLGIWAFTQAAVRLGLSGMPGNATSLQLWGVGAIAGIGFTVALFVAGLAFAGQPELLNEAKLGILAGSILSGVVGFGILRFSPRPAIPPAPARA